MFAARVTVGVGEAGLYPAACSLLCDYFPPQHRGRAFGIFGQAGTLGQAFALLGGAALYRLISENQAAIGALGRTLAPWQLTFLAAGAPGLLLVLAFLFVKEPPRRALRPSKADEPSIIAFLGARKWLFGGLLAHFALYLMASTAALSWAAAYYMRRFGVSLFDAGVTTGFIVAVGSLGSLLTGLLGDRWIRRRAYGGRLRAAAVSFVLFVPGILLWFLSSAVAWSVVGGIMSYLAICCTQTAAPLTLADITPQEYRGRMGAIYLGACSLFGMVMGPLAVAILTDFVFRDESKVNYSVATTALASVVLSTAIAALSVRGYSNELFGLSPSRPRGAEAAHGLR
jgi:MFS family permease